MISYESNVQNLVKRWTYRHPLIEAGRHFHCNYDCYEIIMCYYLILVSECFIADGLLRICWLLYRVGNKMCRSLWWYFPESIQCIEMQICKPMLLTIYCPDMIKTTKLLVTFCTVKKKKMTSHKRFWIRFFVEHDKGTFGTGGNFCHQGQDTEIAPPKKKNLELSKQTDLTIHWKAHSEEKNNFLNCSQSNPCRAFIRSRRNQPRLLTKRKKMLFKKKFFFFGLLNQWIVLTLSMKWSNLTKKSHWTSWCSHFSSLFQERFGIL
jgi:hypothetical protein